MDKGNNVRTKKGYLDILKNHFGTILQPYCETKHKMFSYLRPYDYMGNVSFQIISNDTDINTKKLGDPVGYCLAWTFWYLEMRVKNPDIHPKELISLTITDIINTNVHNDEKVDHAYIFIDFIRNYASKLDNEKNNYLIKCNIPEKYIYNLIPRLQDELLISEKSIEIFNKIMKDKTDIV